MAGQWQGGQWQPGENVQPPVQRQAQFPPFRESPGQYGQQQYPPPPQFPYPPQYGRHQAPRRRPGALIAGAAAAVIVITGGAAFYLLHGSSTGKPQTCAQQYQAWKTGPASAAGKKLEADSAAVGKAGQDIKVMSTGLQAMGADATALQAYPMPACADPAGYWAQYLGAIRASGDNAGTASGLGGIILAEAPLKQVPGIQSRLTAELARTTRAPAES